ncbi:hypothetical protein RN001_007484 [Aquatica leii]|uniref:Uncharacterized protein n=1 Tax=Aquatica leii TaxID=1421715 RepID=A0AAN7P9L1_9COLE|nr:hypothetical protein RN001_007484 [Aquatica leii]
MKYLVISCILAVVAAAPKPQVGTPYNPYYNNPYAYPNRYVNPSIYNPNAAYNPYYRNPEIFTSPQYYNQPQPHVYAKYAAPAIAETRESRPDGSYLFSYATADGQQVQAEGHLKSTAPGVETPVVTGSYSYTAPDGTPVSVNYVADEFGFRAHGPQIPNADAIDKSIAFNIESERYRGPIHN